MYTEIRDKSPEAVQEAFSVPDFIQQDDTAG